VDTKTKEQRECNHSLSKPRSCLNAFQLLVVSEMDPASETFSKHAPSALWGRLSPARRQKVRYLVDQKATTNRGNKRKHRDDVVTIPWGPSTSCSASVWIQFNLFFWMYLSHYTQITEMTLNTACHIYPANFPINRRRVRKKRCRSEIRQTLHKSWSYRWNYGMSRYMDDTRNQLINFCSFEALRIVSGTNFLL
jgi:hypothetical protein